MRSSIKLLETIGKKIAKKKQQKKLPKSHSTFKKIKEGMLSPSTVLVNIFFLGLHRVCL